MRPWTAAVLALAAAVAATVAGAQAPRSTAPRPPASHGRDELQCAACHKSTHVAVQGIYGGTAGRGAPAAPARMFELRVQCLACHTAPADDAVAALGQTYRANDAACGACHGARYDGLTDRWRTAFAAMRERLGTKLRTTRAAIAAKPAHAAHGRARALVDDADWNVTLVSMGNGAHNPFYAANLLRRAGEWLDEAAALVGPPGPKTSDALLAGGYCATLCHEPAGVKVPATATFRGRPFPHGRHAAELGATCATCHSSDVHKALVATPATCSGCHHGPGNERCETCHRDQTAFYRGTLTAGSARIAPNVMASSVGCTGCHDFSLGKARGSIATACTGCHDRAYLALLTEWTTGFARDVAGTAGAVRAADAAIAQARQGGRSTRDAEALMKEAHAALALVRAGGPAHNPLAADELLRSARDRVERARTGLATR